MKIDQEPAYTNLLTAELVKEAGEMAGRAFLNDPLSLYAESDAAKRTRFITKLCTDSLRYGQRHGQVFRAGLANSLKGVAMWLPPQKPSVDLVKMLQAGAISWPFTFGWSTFSRFNHCQELCEQHHKKLMPEPHWYLMILAVDPESQGQGVGSKLLQPILTKADQEKLPCYLETYNQANLAFYARYGFKTVEELTISSGGPSVWMLRRNPL